MNRSTKRLALALFLSAAAVALSACNTVSGAGQDLQEASQNTSEAIDRAVND